MPHRIIIGLNSWPSSTASKPICRSRIVCRQASRSLSVSRFEDSISPFRLWQWSPRGDCETKSTLYEIMDRSSVFSFISAKYILTSFKLKSVDISPAASRPTTPATWCHTSPSLSYSFCHPSSLPRLFTWSTLESSKLSTAKTAHLYRQRRQRAYSLYLMSSVSLSRWRARDYWQQAPKTPN